MFENPVTNNRFWGSHAVGVKRLGLKRILFLLVLYSDVLCHRVVYEIINFFTHHMCTYKVKLMFYYTEKQHIIFIGG